MKPPAIMPATRFVKPDEPVWMLVEVPIVDPAPGMGLRRVQVIYVVRDDELAEYRRDIGPFRKFNAPPLRIISLFDHSVAECQYIAEDQRLNDTYWVKRIQEIRDASTLISDFYDQLEEAKKRIGNRSTFGPGVTIQRNGISKEHVYAQ